jgi:hypothetical protein
MNDPFFDGFVKSPITEVSVIPAKAGIQLFQNILDPGFRRGDVGRNFLRNFISLFYMKLNCSASLKAQG